MVSSYTLCSINKNFAKTGILVTNYLESLRWKEEKLDYIPVSPGWIILGHMTLSARKCIHLIFYLNKILIF